MMTGPLNESCVQQFFSFFLQAVKNGTGPFLVTPYWGNYFHKHEWRSSQYTNIGNHEPGFGGPHYSKLFLLTLDFLEHAVSIRGPVRVERLATSHYNMCLGCNQQAFEKEQEKEDTSSGVLTMIIADTLSSIG